VGGRQPIDPMDEDFRFSPNTLTTQLCMNKCPFKGGSPSGIGWDMAQTAVVLRVKNSPAPCSAEGRAGDSANELPTPGSG
jgi:hypothetical protein